MKKLLLLVLVGCGSNTPPPKVEETPAPTQTAERTAPVPVVQQELGSIDERGVEVAFQNLGGPLEKCHTEGRDRNNLVAGDVKTFMRVGADGKVKYAFFEHSSLGDRATEKCILQVLTRAQWPKPIGGEAEVRHGFGWEAGQERKPVDWTADKVTGALDSTSNKKAKEAIAACKASAEIKFTAYVEKAEVDEEPMSEDPAPKKPASLRAAPPPKKTPPKHEPKKVEIGQFKAIGAATKDKGAAEAIDCMIDALGKLHMSSPGSYPAKVSFKL